MIAEQNRQKGLYWTPRGGNNARDIWASCHLFTSVTENKRTGDTETTTVIVDMGQHEAPWLFANGEYDKVVPALDDCLAVKGLSKPENPASAVFLTHCHSDHTTGIFEYLQMGTEIPPVYGSRYTLNALQKGLIDLKIPSEKWPEMKCVKTGDSIRIGNLTVDVFPASHSVPGCFSFRLSNGEASIFHSGDTKADETSFLGRGVDVSSYKRIGRNGGVDLMTFDSTAVHLKGHATSEAEIFETYREIFEQNAGRQIIAPLSAAHMERLASVVCAAAAAGKNVVINGGASMEKNVLALKTAGYDLHAKCPNIQIVGAKGAAKLDPETCVTVTTGNYAEPNSPFVRCLRGEKNGFVLRPDAVVIAPTSGDKNEKLLSVLEKSGLDGLKLITGIEKPRVYGSGHAQADDFVKIANSVRPRMVAPIHCFKERADVLNALATKNGFMTLPEYPHNGTTVVVSGRTGARIESVKSPEWFGIRHETDSKGNVKTSFVKVADGGYSTDYDKEAGIARRQKEAMKKIAGYRFAAARKRGFIAERRGGDGR